MAFPLSPVDQEVYTTPLGVVYRYELSRNAWNIVSQNVGVTGIQGYTGLQGIDGQTGIRGQTGIQGLTGLYVQGQTGIAGNTGIQGLTGFYGQTGIRGVTGLYIQGQTGIAGNTGIQGLTGLYVQGQTGIQGLTGFYGQTGIAGNTGIQGVTGLGSDNRVFTWSVASPAAGGVYGGKLYQQFTAAKISSYSDGTCGFNIQDRTSAPATTGLTLLATDQTAIPAGVDGTTLQNTVCPANSWLYLDVKGVSGTPTKLMVTIAGTI